MEDHFYKILSLFVGLIYLFLNNAKNSNTKKQAIESGPSGLQTVPTNNMNSSNTWKDKTQKAPIRKFRLQPITKKEPSLPVHHTTQLATQQRSGQKINHVLRRYSGWKKAIIMSELIRPYG
jgi:hypothetical protein